MKIAVLVVFSFIAGWIGLIYGMVLGGLAVHAPDFSLRDLDGLVVLCGIGAVVAFIGRAFGSKIGWIPAAAYCAPLLLGGAFAASAARWESGIASVLCTVISAAIYWIAHLWVVANKMPNTPS